MKAKFRLSLIAGAALAAAVAGGVSAQQNNMTFFVTSTNQGSGGNLGGITGADQFCQNLARSVGAGNKTWHAFSAPRAWAP